MSRSLPSLQDMGMSSGDVLALVAASKDVVEAVSFDDSGRMIAGKWMGGNGGMLSRETLIKTDTLRRAIAKVEITLRPSGEER